MKSYTPPSLHTGKDWYIWFQAFDPSLGKMRRKRIRINFVGSKKDRRAYAADLKEKITIELRQGWNPWLCTVSSQSYKTFEEACGDYDRYLTKLLEQDLMRDKTVRGYRSMMGMIQRWNESRKIRKTYIYQFDHKFCVDFIDWLWLDKGCSGRTRDNYLNWLKTFSSYLLEKEYIASDPTAGISNLGNKKGKKNRTVIPAEDIRRLKVYLSENNRHFLLASYILYYCFIRPKEMSFIKLEHISIQRGTIFIPDYSSKNRKDGTVTLPDKVVKLMIELDAFRYPSSYYLFSDKMLPGEKQHSSKQFTDYWHHYVCKNLHFPPEYKFYSLKDTGITALIRKNVDLISVRNQARHHSLLMTDIYTPRDIENANEVIQKNDGEF